MKVPDPSFQMCALQCPTASRSHIEFDPRNRKRCCPPEATPEPIRKSRRLQEQQLGKQTSSISPNEIKLQHDNLGRQDQLPSPSSNRTQRAGSPHHSITPSNIGIGDRKRKAETVIENIQALSQVLDEPHRKRLHTNNTVLSTSVASARIQNWIHESRWPKRDFEPDPNMDRPVPKRPRSSSSQGSQTDTSTPIVSDGSDQKSRTQKSSPYAKQSYEILLALKNGYMHDSDAGILVSERKDCESFLDAQQDFPSNSLFDDECFFETCANLKSENEMRVVIDLLRLITPSAENSAARGIKELKCLKEHANAGWDESIPVEGPRPQPDYSVGFRYSTFSHDQISKLHRHLKSDAKTFFSATLGMYFPFLTTEVKCGNQAIEIADRQNAHSMTVAIRGVVELFRKIGRAEELHQKALGFSISHDHEQVKIYVHYAEIDDVHTKCYRHLLKKFFIESENGKERWSAYQFVRNVYDSFVPVHLKRIKSAIDQLPDLALEPFQFTLSSNEDAESSQDMVASSAPSSQQAGFKKPAIPRRGSVAQLRAQIDRLLEEAKLLREEAKQREDRLREESQQREDRLREESKHREDRLREESKHREKELMDMLKQRLS